MRRNEELSGLFLSLPLNRSFATRKLGKDFYLYKVPLRTPGFVQQPVQVVVRFALTIQPYSLGYQQRPIFGIGQLLFSYIML